MNVDDFLPDNEDVEQEEFNNVSLLSPTAKEEVSLIAGNRLILIVLIS